MKNILCIFNLHKWEIKKSIKASNLISLIKKSKAILKKSTFELENDYVIEDKKCVRCEKEISDIIDTKRLFEEKLSNTLRKKKQ